MSEQVHVMTRGLAHVVDLTCAESAPRRRIGGFVTQPEPPVSRVRMQQGHQVAQLLSERAVHWRARTSDRCRDVDFRPQFSLVEVN